jgi:MarR family transcriptional regulator, transcriptional regulator for hemolysin
VSFGAEVVGPGTRAVRTSAVADSPPAVGGLDGALRPVQLAQLCGHASIRASDGGGGRFGLGLAGAGARALQAVGHPRIAEAVGISGATMTHHLNPVEARGLVRRWREAGNRRVQRTALTPAGEEMFGRPRQVAAR